MFLLIKHYLLPSLVYIYVHLFFLLIRGKKGVLHLRVMLTNPVQTLQSLKHDNVPCFKNTTILLKVEL